MKKYTPAQLVRMLLVPALTVLLGLVLLFSPDTASALVGKLLAWCCILAALGFGAGAFFGSAAQRNRRILWAVICFAAGLWMLLNPLVIAKVLGRLLGLGLMIRGGQALAEDVQKNGRRFVPSPALMLAVVTAAVGLVLVLLPLASSRMLFSILGIILICVGIAQGIDNIRGRNLLDEGDDPNIIDVEKL